MTGHRAIRSAAAALAALVLSACAGPAGSPWLFSPLPPQTPTAPTDLRVTFVPWQGLFAVKVGEFLLNWADNSDNELGFVVEQYFPRSTAETAEDRWARVATLPAGTRAHFVSVLRLPDGPGAGPGASSAVAFRVKAYNVAGPSAYSNEAWDCVRPYLPGTCRSPVDAIASAVLPPPPAAPAGVQATQGAAISRIYVSWQAVPDAVAYRVYQFDPHRSEFLPREPVVADGFTSATGLFDAGRSYAFRVTALNAAGRESSPSAVAIGWAGSGAPATVMASYGDPAYPDRIVVQWAPVQSDLDTGQHPPQPVMASQYDLYQQVTAVDWQKIGGTGVLSGAAQARPSITVADVVANSEYAFAVVSIYPCDAPPANQCQSELGLSPIARGCAGPLCRTLPTPAPTASDGLCSDCDTPARVEVRWTTVNGAIGYDLSRAPSPWGPWTPLLQQSPATTYTDSPVSTWTSYWYCVQAVGAQGQRSPFGCDWGHAGRLTSYFSTDLGRCFPSCEHPADLPQ